MDSTFWYFEYFSIFGVGIHVVIAVFFAIHALKTGRPFFWLWILFVFPFLGSIVYFVAEYLPQSRLPHQANRLGQRALFIFQPNKLLNVAKEKYEHVPSVENAVNYSEILIAKNRAKEAIVILEQKLNGFVENDPAFLEQLAMAYLQDEQVTKVFNITAQIKTINADYKPEHIALMRALSYHLLNDQDHAKQEFLIATRSKGIVYLAEYALWAVQTQQIDLVHQIRAEMQKSWVMGTAYSRKMHKPIFRQLDKAIKDMKKNMV